MSDEPRDEGDPWPGYVAAALVLAGLGYLVFAVVFPLLLDFAMELDRQAGKPTPPPEGRAVMFGVFALLCAGFAAVNFVGAWGVKKRTKWGWIVGICLGGLYAPSICLPFGAVILYGLLNERTRKRMLGS